MHELWVNILGFVKLHWLDFVLGIASIVVVKGLLRQPLDDRGRLIKDPKKRPSKYGWYVAGALLGIYWLLRITGVAFPSLGHISKTRWVWSALIVVGQAILVVVAQKQKELTGDTWYMRGIYGSAAWSVGLATLILFGFSFWSLGLTILGVALCHFYVIPNRHLGVGVLFGRWLVSDNRVELKEDKDGNLLEEFYDEGHTIWTLFKQALTPGLCLLPLPYWCPGWDLRLIKDELRYVGSEERPIYTPELNTAPNPDDPDGIGGIVRYQFFGRFRTAQNLARLRKQPDKVRNNPELFVSARVIACLRLFANEYTLAEHLTKKSGGTADNNGAEPRPNYKDGLKDKLETMYREVAREFGVGEIEFEVLDPEVSEKVRASVEDAAAADRKIITRRKAGEAAGAELKAQIDAVRKATETPEGEAAADRLIELEYARNGRTIRFAGAEGLAGAAAAAAKTLGDETEAKSKSKK
jgi:hypothetical protein